MLLGETTGVPLTEYGPVWALVGLLLLGAAYAGKRLLSQTQAVTDAQVATLSTAQEEMRKISDNGSATAHSCDQANLKLDAHSRLFESGLSSLKQWADQANDDVAKSHVVNLENQLRSDLARIRS